MLMKHRRETAGGIEPKQNGQDVDGDAVPHEIKSGGHPPRGGDGGERTAEDNQTSDNRPAATQGRRDYNDHKDGIKQSVTASDVTQSEDGATLRSGMQGAVSGMGGVVGERVSEVSDVIQERVSDWSGALQETVNDLGDVIQERVSEAGQAVDQAAAGLKGIEEGYELPPEASANVFEMTDEERAAEGMRPLPQSLSEALDAMERSELVAEALGEHIFEWFLRNKRAEWQDYKSQVTQFELDRYLPAW